MSFADFKEQLRTGTITEVNDQEYANSMRDFLSSRIQSVKDWYSDSLNVLSQKATPEEIAAYTTKYTEMADTKLMKVSQNQIAKISEVSAAVLDSTLDDVDMSEINIECKSLDDGVLAMNNLYDCLSDVQEQIVAAESQIGALDEVYAQAQSEVIEGSVTYKSNVSDFVTKMKNSISGKLNSVEEYATYYSSIITNPYLSVKEKVSGIINTLPISTKESDITVDFVPNDFISIDATQYTGKSPVEAWLSEFNFTVNWESVGQSIWTIFKFQMLWPLKLLSMAWNGLKKGIVNAWNYITTAPIVNDLGKGDKYFNIPLYQGSIPIAQLENVNVPAIYPSMWNQNLFTTADNWIKNMTGKYLSQVINDNISEREYLDITLSGMLIRLWKESSNLCMVAWVGLTNDIFDDSVSYEYDQSFSTDSQVPNFNTFYTQISNSLVDPGYSPYYTFYDDAQRFIKGMVNTIERFQSSWQTITGILRTDYVTDMFDSAIKNNNTTSPYSMSSLITRGSLYCPVLRAMFPQNSMTLEPSGPNGIYGSVDYMEFVGNERLSALYNGNYGSTTPLQLLNAFCPDVKTSLDNDGRAFFFYLLPYLAVIGQSGSRDMYVPYVKHQADNIVPRYALSNTDYWTSRVKKIAITIGVVAAIAATVVVAVKVRKRFKTRIQELTGEQWTLYGALEGMDPKSEQYRETIGRLVKVQRRLDRLGGLASTASTESASIFQTLTSRYGNSVNSVQDVVDQDMFAEIKAVHDVIIP